MSESIKVHPLVIMSIADHYTREKVRKNTPRVLGALFGKQNGREVDILESVEFLWTVKEGVVSIEQKAFEDDMKLFIEAYDGHECLGWYATSAAPLENDIEIHRQMAAYNERPLCLMLNPTPAEDGRELPCAIYVEEVKVIHEKTTNELVKCQFEIFSDEGERITAVHCAKVVTGAVKGQSAVTTQSGSLTKAVSMLDERLTVLNNFLKDTADGKVKKDHAILRELKGMCNRLPTMDSLEFKEDMLTEYNDALLITYLSSITKGTNLATEVVERCNSSTLGGGVGGGSSHRNPARGMGMF